MIHVRRFAPHARIRFVSALLLCAFTLAGAGCTGITVRRVTAGELPSAQQEGVLAGGSLSARSLQTLHELDLDSLYRRSPVVAYAELQALAAQDPKPDTLFVLAELSYL